MNFHSPRAPNNAVLTLALGKPFYFELACNLARSFRLWHSDNRIKFTLVTDTTESLPSDLVWCELVRVEPAAYGTAFTPKLSLDLLATAERTIFIDADCLIYEPLDRMFTKFAGRPVATVGSQTCDGEWWGDVAALCRQLNVTSIPKFNGGIYYLERGEVTTSVYRCARELVRRYDELGLVRFRGHPTDELVMASAMSLHGLTAVPDDGTFMWPDLPVHPEAIKVNVFAGRRRIRSFATWDDPVFQPRYPIALSSPTVVHFHGCHALEYPYRAEAARLALAARHIPRWFANLAAIAGVEIPGWAVNKIKQFLRPFYHLVFSARPVRLTPRDQAQIVSFIVAGAIKGSDRN